MPSIETDSQVFLFELIQYLRTKYEKRIDFLFWPIMVTKEKRRRKLNWMSLSVASQVSVCLCCHRQTCIQMPNIDLSAGLRTDRVVVSSLFFRYTPLAALLLCVRLEAQSLFSSTVASLASLQDNL